MGKGLTAFAAILALITTWFLGTASWTVTGNYVYGLGGLIGFFSKITTIFSGLNALGIVYLILAFLWAIAPILILIGIGVRPLAIIFGIILLVPGIGFLVYIIGNAVSVSGIASVGGYIYQWIDALNYGPLVSNIIPYVLLGSNSIYFVVFGGSISGLLAIIGGAMKKEK